MISVKLIGTTSLTTQSPMSKGLSIPTIREFMELAEKDYRPDVCSVELFRLHRYLDQQAFRFNERKGSNSNRIKLAASQVGGKRLTYKALTGKTSWQSESQK